MWGCVSILAHPGGSVGGTVYPARFHCPNNRHLPLPPHLQLVDKRRMTF